MKTLILGFSLLLISKFGCTQTQTPAALNCNNWLYTSQPNDKVTLGDLDVAGNQITVEAVFLRTASYSPNYLYAGDIVSKHDSPSDVNYLLRPNDAEITTTSGYHIAAANCEIELNKIYHVAMVYNGSSLKFYRNGFLMAETPCSGNLITNDWVATIGDYAYPFPAIGTNFIGYINEVRIWNVARSQEEIRDNMFTSLVNPASEFGLLAYYSFNSTTNLQGTSIWNGVLNNGAVLSSTVSDCTLRNDSCATPIPVKLRKFDALEKSPNVELRWSTSFEVNFSEFRLLKSSNGIDFVNIKTVKAINRELGSTYSVIDSNVNPGLLYYYKLEMVDLDGTTTVSDVRTVRLHDQKDRNFVLSPNPSRSFVRMQTKNLVGQGEVSIINNLGIELLRQKLAVYNGARFKINTEKLPAGIYFLILHVGDYRETQQFVKY